MLVDILGELMTTRPSVFRALIALAICITAGLLIAAQPTTTDTHRFTAIRNGIYLAQTTAPVFNSNAVVIVNEDDVVAVYYTHLRAHETLRYRVWRGIRVKK